MTDDEKLMQQALEALTAYDGTNGASQRKRVLAALRDRLAQPQMQPCAGRNCGSTNPNLHSAECFEDYEKATGMAQPEQHEMTNIERHERNLQKFLAEQPAQQEPVWDTSAPLVMTPHPAFQQPPQRKPEQEPVAWLSTDSIGERHLCFDKPLDNDPVQPLYTAPPPPEQEPVPGVVMRYGFPTLLPDRDIKPTDARLYTAPPQRKPLTDEERKMTDTELLWLIRRYYAEQSEVALLLETLEEIAYGLESARIWGGMDWTYNPLHPYKYLPLRDKARAAIAKATGENK